MKSILIKALALCALGLLIMPGWVAYAADPTTDVRVVKYASDGTTVVNETTVDYQWMEANLPVQGDGVTHYYMQGPVFNESMDKWDPEETTNFKDKGAARGTDIADLCNLVGGMAPNDTVRLCAIDGYCINFSYQNVYRPQDRQGPIVLSWYSVENGSLGQQQETGYPPRYFEAMQLVFMPKTANAEGLYVFGNWDMHECLPDEAQHFYNELYPSTNGLSVKWISEIAIYPEGAPIPSQPVDDDGSSSNNSSSTFTIWLGIGAAVIVLLAVAILVMRRRS
jgi:hypothetical protein